MEAFQMIKRMLEMEPSNWPTAEACFYVDFNQNTISLLTWFDYWQRKAPTSKPAGMDTPLLRLLCEKYIQVDNLIDMVQLMTEIGDDINAPDSYAVQSCLTNRKCIKHAVK